uniref:Ubiquitin-like protease family profile domain-containing protein n=1 Tax=Rhodosorus marinus TaxID=101924 RepID=A0A7S2ZF95_9RHOD|mmetsp:Transcript_17492/g.70875  ORF Transcript_17492/g.70875 Transcript_17492/m.70875 type:complete len:192 (+) Transcript_17492:606-1181(+)
MHWSGFFEEYLRVEVANNDPRVCFVSPNVAFLVAQSGLKEIAEELLTTLNLPEKELILIPVNDAGAGPSQLNYNKAVGNHWSLLVIHEGTGPFELNSVEARSVSSAAKLITALLPVGKTLSDVKLLRSPKQSNHSDCGVYVCAMMETVLQAFLVDAQMQEFSGVAEEDLPYSSPAIMRLEMRKLVREKCGL